MKMKNTIAAAILAVGLAAGTAAAQKPEGRRDFHRFGTALELTEAQKQHARDLFAQSREASQPIRAELRKNREELAAAVKTNNTAVIQQLTERQGVLSGQLSALHAKSMASFYAGLTPEQRAKADELQAKRKERAGEFRRGFRGKAAPRQ